MSTIQTIIRELQEQVKHAKTDQEAMELYEAIQQLANAIER